MYVIHSGHLNVKSGGPALSTWLTVKGLRKLGIKTDIIMPPIPEDDHIIDESAQPLFCKEPKFGSLAYIPNFNILLESLGKADIYHAHGMWMLHSTQMARYALQNGKPYIITPRGMFYPQALAHNALVKKISMYLYQADTLRKAAVIQCTCIEEMEHYRNLGFKNPVAVIPNPIETEGIIDRPLILKKQFRIGYLGRVHPRKRIERLIYAIDHLKERLPEDCELLIIGGGDPNYESFLHAEVERLGLNNVHFTGFLSGKEKDDAMNSLSILVVPSDFENFGNIVTEALVRGISVIASKGMPWQHLPENGCGWWVSNDQDSIDRTILEAYLCGAERLREMGLKGRELISREYSVESLGSKMKSLYEWILGKGPKPEFVYV